jgi:RES domain-containing protein
LTIVWRITAEPFADLTGEGARLYGARWNSPGRPMLYTAEDAALAILEVRVHLDLDWTLLPDDYVLMRIEVHDLPTEHITDLPSDPQAVGDAWLKSGTTPLLRVPSFIVPESFNLLVNPSHSQAAAIRDYATRDFKFDERLWLPLKY